MQFGDMLNSFFNWERFVEWSNCSISSLSNNIRQFSIMSDDCVVVLGWIVNNLSAFSVWIDSGAIMGSSLSRSLWVSNLLIKFEGITSVKEGDGSKYSYSHVVFDTKK